MSIVKELLLWVGMAVVAWGYLVLWASTIFVPFIVLYLLAYYLG